MLSSDFELEQSGSKAGDCFQKCNVIIWLSLKLELNWCFQLLSIIWLLDFENVKFLYIIVWDNWRKNNWMLITKYDIVKQIAINILTKR